MKKKIAHLTCASGSFFAHSAAIVNSLWQQKHICGSILCAIMTYSPLFQCGTICVCHSLESLVGPHTACMQVCAALYVCNISTTAYISSPGYGGVQPAAPLLNSVAWRHALCWRSINSTAYVLANNSNFLEHICGRKESSACCIWFFSDDVTSVATVWRGSGVSRVFSACLRRDGNWRGGSVWRKPGNGGIW